MTKAKSKTKNIDREKLADSQKVIFVYPQNRDFLRGKFKTPHNPDEIKETIGFDLGSFVYSSWFAGLLLIFFCGLFAIMAIFGAEWFLKGSYDALFISSWSKFLLIPYGIFLVVVLLTVAFGGLYVVYKQFAVTSKTVDDAYNNLVKYGDIAVGKIVIVMDFGDESTNAPYIEYVFKDSAGEQKQVSLYTSNTDFYQRYTNNNTINSVVVLYNEKHHILL